MSAVGWCRHEDVMPYEKAYPAGWIATIDQDPSRFMARFDPERVTPEALLRMRGLIQRSQAAIFIFETDTWEIIMNTTSKTIACTCLGEIMMHRENKTGFKQKRIM